MLVTPSGISIVFKLEQSKKASLEILLKESGNFTSLRELQDLKQWTGNDVILLFISTFSKFKHILKAYEFILVTDSGITISEIAVPSKHPSPKYFIFSCKLIYFKDEHPPKDSAHNFSTELGNSIFSRLVHPKNI